MERKEPREPDGLARPGDWSAEQASPFTLFCLSEVASWGQGGLSESGLETGPKHRGETDQDGDHRIRMGTTEERRPLPAEHGILTQPSWEAGTLLQ